MNREKRRERQEAGGILELGHDPRRGKAASLDYAPLPEQVKQRVLERIKTIKFPKADPKPGDK